jgi:hypothetical protein
MVIIVEKAQKRKNVMPLTFPNAVSTVGRTPAARTFDMACKNPIHLSFLSLRLQNHAQQRKFAYLNIVDLLQRTADELEELVAVGLAK